MTFQHLEYLLIGIKLLMELKQIKQLKKILKKLLMKLNNIEYLQQEIIKEYMVMYLHHSQTLVFGVQMKVKFIGYKN